MADQQRTESFTDSHTADGVGAVYNGNKLRLLLRRPIGSELCDNWSAIAACVRRRLLGAQSSRGLSGSYEHWLMMTEPWNHVFVSPHQSRSRPTRVLQWIQVQLESVFSWLRLGLESNEFVLIITWKLKNHLFQEIIAYFMRALCICIWCIMDTHNYGQYSSSAVDLWLGLGLKLKRLDYRSTGWAKKVSDCTLSISSLNTDHFSQFFYQ